jgi:hypothetical protein
MAATIAFPGPLRARAGATRYLRRVGGRGRTLFRLLTVAGFAATVAITWPLWSVHNFPPMVPLLPLPALSLGIPLLVASALALVSPLPGAIVLTLVLAYAILIDGTRLQPQFISLLFLLWGTVPNPNAAAVARTHLITLWLYSGINKLLSPAFIHGTAQWLLSGLVPHAPHIVQQWVGYAMALAEIALGVLALIPRTRLLAAFGALVVHLGILLDLSPLGHDYNRSVWPWNVVLAAAGFALIATWRETPQASFAACSRLLRPFLVALTVLPLGFYVGIVDPYLAHNLYSSNTPVATYCHGTSCVVGEQVTQTDAFFNVSLPPDYRIYDGSFQRTCRPGDRLMIADSRWWYRTRGRGEVTIPCHASM